MCGITGVFNIKGEPVLPEILHSMTNVISHRGPDSYGYYTNRNLGFGHRRLAILDLSDAAHQPLLSKDNRYVISYNGEIYNFQDIRAELIELGFQFNSHSDTEVVLQAFAQWQEKALLRFNGMFAFAIWDNENEELFLARDRYGIKPLYYTLQNNNFIFASEIKAILKHPNYRKDIDQEALLEYFTFQNFFTNKTLFKDIFMLPAGSFLRLSKKKSPEIFRYWDYLFSETNSTKNDNEYVEELDRLFQQAVKRQLVSDVSIGSYLSGGMDSGSITALATNHIPDLKTFTIGFDLNSASGLELGFDERDKAEFMSYLFKTEHYQMVLKAGDMERVLAKMLWHLEVPRVGQSYPNFYAAKLASKFNKVVLSGAGGDELFGGYPWRYYRAVINDDFEHYIDKYYFFWQRLLNPEEITGVFSPIWHQVKHVSTRDIFRDVFHKHVAELNKPEDYINHSLYFEAKTFLHGLLVVEDKLSMAHGLETRLPFLDNELVDFAMALPIRYKLGNLSKIIELNENEPGPKTLKYFEKAKDGKLILRKVMQRHIPKAITDLAKQGFSAPDASWFKGDSIDYVRKILFNNSAQIYNFLDRTKVQDLVNQHLIGKQNRRLLIWSLLNFEHWCLQFL